MSLFQLNLRKQIRKLPKILKSVKIIHYYSIVFIIIHSCPYCAQPAAAFRGRAVEVGSANDGRRRQEAEDEGADAPPRRVHGRLQLRLHLRRQLACGRVAERRVAERRVVERRVEVRRTCVTPRT